MNRTEQIFYLRTYTKYIVTIQYIYTFFTFGICYTAIMCMLVLEIIIVYVYFLYFMYCLFSNRCCTRNV